MRNRNGDLMLIRLLIIVIIGFIVLGVAGPYLGLNTGKSEEYSENKYEYYIQYGWVLCQPGDQVNIRTKPNRKSHSIGLYEAGDYFVVDMDKQKKGWVYCEKLSLEETEGWIFSGYVVYDEPVPKGGAYYQVISRGRVACRKWIDGPRRCWVRNGNTVRVWYWSEDWCVTNRGFIQTRYLKEIDTIVEIGTGAGPGN